MFRTLGLALIALLLAASGCGGQSSASESSGGDGSGGKLTLVAYSTPEEAYKELIPAFTQNSPMTMSASRPTCEHSNGPS